MRTSIVTEDRLMEDALKATGLGVKKEVVATGFETPIRLKKPVKTRNPEGSLCRAGGVAEMG